MKKSEITQLTQIIELIVTKEIRKQLPSIIAETFQNMMGKQIVTNQPPSQNVQESIKHSDNDNFKMSMRELFGGTPTNVTKSQPQKPKHFTNNSVLNEILNSTTSDLRQREHMVGGAAMMGGYSPSVAMAASTMGGMGMSSMTGPGEMMDTSDEPSFSNIPTMPGVNSGMPLNSLPQGVSPTLIEGQESDHVPMSNIPEGISALDVARSVPLEAPVQQALTRNYSDMMKLIDSKKKPI